MKATKSFSDKTGFLFEVRKRAKKPKPVVPKGQRLLNSASRTAFALFKLYDKNPELKEKNKPLLQLCNRFINTPKGQRKLDDAFAIFKGADEFRKQIKKKGQKEFGFK